MEGPKRLKSERVVIFKHLFDPKEFEVYRIAGKFGAEFNLAVWRLVWAPPNLIPTKFYIRQNFVGYHF